MVQSTATSHVCVQRNANGRKIAMQDYCTCSQPCNSSAIAVHHSPCCCLQGALMAKAMAVAVLGDEILVPRGYRHSGLVWIYAAICGSIPAQGGLWWAADSFIMGKAGRSSCCAALHIAPHVSLHAIWLLRPDACHLIVLLSAHAAHWQHLGILHCHPCLH